MYFTLIKYKLVQIKELKNKKLSFCKKQFNKSKIIIPKQQHFLKSDLRIKSNYSRVQVSMQSDMISLNINQKAEQKTLIPI